MQIILLSSVIAGVISLIFTYFSSRKHGNLQYRKAVLLSVLVASVLMLPSVASAKITLAKPSISVRANSISAATVTVKTGLNSRVTGYKVEVKTGSGKWHLKKNVKKSKGPSVRLTGLSKSKNTSFRVRTYKKSGKKTTYSSYATVGKRTPTTKIMDIGKSKVTLKVTSSFSAYSKRKQIFNSITGYKVEVKSGSGKWHVKRTIGKTYGYFKDTITLDGLHPNSKYSFRVRTYKKSGKKIDYSSYSTVRMVTTKNSEKKPSTNPTTNIKDYSDGYENKSVAEKDAHFNANYQQKTIDRINYMRSLQHLAPVKLDATLCKMAEVRASENVAMKTWINGDLAHCRDSKTKRGWTSIFDDYNMNDTIIRITENIAYGTNNFYCVGNDGSWDSIAKESWRDTYYQNMKIYDNSWEMAFYKLISTPNDAHRDAYFIKNVDCIGIAYVWDAKQNRSVWVHLFGQYGSLWG